MTLELTTIDLSTVTGGGCRPQLSHADQLKNGNGGIVPKLPDPRSHAGQLARGNGGVAPKTIPLGVLGGVTGGGVFSRAADRRVDAWNKARQSGSQQLHDEFFRRDFNNDWFRP